MRSHIGNIVSFVTVAVVFSTTTLHAQPQNFGFALEVLPKAPIASDAIRARITGVPCSIDPATVTVSSDQAGIRIDVRGVQGCITGPPLAFDVELGRFPAGDYPVRMTVGTVQVGFANVTVLSATKAVAHPLADYTDHWWNAQESGWGLSIMQHPSDNVFAVWYVYDQTRQPVWYTLQPGKWLDFGTYTGPVYKTTGPYYGGVFDPTQVGIVQVGTATLKFGDYTSGTFDYVIEGVVGTKAITRMPF